MGTKSVNQIRRSTNQHIFYSAGKSTTLAILAGLTRASTGSLVFEGNTSRPPRGTLGIVPQKNVLFPELSCLQTLRVWKAVKAVSESESNADLEQLIVDCDLQYKMHEPAGTLSGGQKRKLQLAIGLVGGSKSKSLYFLHCPTFTRCVIQ
jgi:ATP-binding cassette subfamily A (ABC1) protein 3